MAGVGVCEEAVVVRHARHARERRCALNTIRVVVLLVVLLLRLLQLVIGEGHYGRGRGASLGGPAVVVVVVGVVLDLAIKCTIFTLAHSVARSSWCDSTRCVLRLRVVVGGLCKLGGYHFGGRQLAEVSLSSRWRTGI